MQEFGETAQCIVTQVIQINDSGTNWIQMNVIHNLQEVTTIFNMQGLVATLEYMTPLSYKTIKPVAESTRKPLHAPY